MSAFIVEHKTINIVVNHLKYSVSQQQHLTDGLLDLDYDITREAGLSKLATAMYGLNVEAVNQRYGERNEPEQHIYDSMDTDYTIQVIKSLQCWLYQCAEGNVPEQKLYKFFDNDVQLWILKIAVINSIEYQIADWG